VLVSVRFIIEPSGEMTNAAKQGFDLFPDQLRVFVFVEVAELQNHRRQPRHART